MRIRKFPALQAAVDCQERSGYCPQGSQVTSAQTPSPGGSMPAKRPFAPLRGRSHLKSGLMAGALGLTALSPISEASAGDIPIPGFSLYLGYNFGAENSGIAWGLEAYANSWSNWTCEPDDVGVFGPNLRVGFVNLGSPQITVGGRGGVTAQMLTVAGEVGMTYRFSENAGPELNLGLHSHFLLGGLSANYLFGFDEVTVAAHAGLPPLIFSCMGRGMHGRPLRDEKSFAALPDVTRDSTTVDNERAKQASDIWESRAQTEWASVPAFFEVAEQLQAVDAPTSLIHRALEAANDEREHAILAAGMSAKIGGGTLELGNPKTSHRMPLPGKAGLTKLAVESWMDGCLGEGTAARVAFSEASRTPDPILEQTLDQIAQDEAHHAGLAWDVMAWAADQGGKTVTGALEEVRELVPREPAETHRGELEAYGVCSSDEANDIALENRRESLFRLDALLTGKR